MVGVNKRRVNAVGGIDFGTLGVPGAPPGVVLYIRQSGSSVGFSCVPSVVGENKCQANWSVVLFMRVLYSWAFLSTLQTWYFISGCIARMYDVIAPLRWWV